MLNQQANCYYFIGFYILLIIFMIIKETDSIYNDNNIRDSIDNNSNQSINSNEHSSKIYHLNIGAVLSNHLHTLNFIQSISDLSFDLRRQFRLESVTFVMNTNPIRTAYSICEQIITAQAYAVVVSHPMTGNSGLSPSTVSLTCGFYNVPVIGISNRDSSLSNKNIHSSFARMISPFSHQADVWIEILKQLKYHSVVFIHSQDSDGRATLGRFQHLADDANIKIEALIEYEPGISDVVKELQNAKDEYCSVFILYANTEDAESIFREVNALNMTEPGFVWIVSEQALNATNKPDGIIGLKLNATDEKSMIEDSVKVLGNIIDRMYRAGEVFTPPPNHCNKTDENWQLGIQFLKYLKNVSLIGKTGYIRFDEYGDRLFSDYKIINVVNGRDKVVGNFTSDKNNNSKMQLSINVNDISWPGSPTTKPLGIIFPTHLKVVTLAEVPFVWLKPLNTRTNKCDPNQVLCPKKNSTLNTVENYCCEGYCIDLLIELQNRLKFTFELAQAEDGEYGDYEFVDDGHDPPKRWTGLVGEVVYKRADMIVAPLTINPERGQVIDFSKPFKYEGITILQKKRPQKGELASFAQPFRPSLWALVTVSIHVVALALYLLDRFSPFGGYKMKNVIPSDDGSFSLSSSLWFSWGILLNSGIGERTPRSFSARVLGMVWAGFGMIVVASYTANLAAFLVLNPREDFTISGVEDSRLLNPIDSFTIATVKGSAVNMFFSRQVELANAYRRMEETNKNSPEEAIEALKAETLDAFIYDSPRLEYEAAKDCELITTGEPFGKSGYGIGFQKNSYWTEQVTLALLGMHESGFMESLDNKWILASDKECEDKNEGFPYTLGMKNMAGVFILVFAGIITGMGLIIIEIIYKKRKERKERRLKIAKKLAIKWRLLVQKKRSRYSKLYPSKYGVAKFDNNPHLITHSSIIKPSWTLPSSTSKNDVEQRHPIKCESSGKSSSKPFVKLNRQKCVADSKCTPIPTNYSSRPMSCPLPKEVNLVKFTDQLPGSRSSTPQSDSDFSTSIPFIIPPPPPPPVINYNRAAHLLIPYNKRSAQQKIYEFKHRKSMGYE